MHASNMCSNIPEVSSEQVYHGTRLAICPKIICLWSNASSMLSDIYVDTYLADPLHSSPRHELEIFASIHCCGRKGHGKTRKLQTGYVDRTSNETKLELEINKEDTIAMEAMCREMETGIMKVDAEIVM